MVCLIETKRCSTSTGTVPGHTNCCEYYNWRETYQAPSSAKVSGSGAIIHTCVEYTLNRFTEGVTPCLIRVSGVKELWSGVEALRAESYQQTNPQHEEVLMEVHRHY